MLGKKWVVGLVASLVLVASGRADVFNMGGTRNPDGSWTGLASLETVPVGNPGNSADTRYATPGYGAVDYAYNISKYEVTAGQYTEFLNAVAATDTYGLYNPYMWHPVLPSVSDRGCKIERIGTLGSYTYSVAPDRANRPVNYVSWGDAARFCNWLHNGQPTGVQDDSTTEAGAYDLNGATSAADLMAVTRESGSTWFIPTENEWYKAAYHKNDGVTANYFDYPTSSDTVPSNDLIDPDPGNNANFSVASGHISDLTIGSPYFTTEVGEFENSESPYDTFDQGGNLWEWNETAVTGSSRGLRGGNWSDNFSSMLCTNRHGSGYDPTHEYLDLGFRVASSQVVPEPTCLCIWSLLGAAVGVGAWRRRRNR